MINLLPYKEKKIIKKIRQIRLARTVVYGCIGFCIVAGLLLVPTILTINSRFSLTNKQVSSLEKSGAMASSVDIAALEKKAKQASLKLSIASTVEPTEYIDLVKSHETVGIVINRFASTTSAFLEVSGVARDRESLQTFISLLQKDPRIAIVDSPVANFIKNKNSVFTLSISFK
jgi:Tfp pilus assembly protein PilN